MSESGQGVGAARATAGGGGAAGCWASADGVQVGVVACYGWTTDGALVRSNAMPCGEAAVAANCVGDVVQAGVVANAGVCEFAFVVHGWCVLSR